MILDPRISARGGTRRDSRSNYDFPGMARDSDWRKTQVHENTAYYGCSVCGQRFTGPHAVYTHLAKRHGR